MKNELEILVEKSGLESTKSKILLDNFSNYFKIASEWEQKAKSILVTDEEQVAEMQMARTGRLFLKEKRLAIEKTRKELKEQSLREGKAIDGIANVLKALIVPIEEYLDQQEHFVELKIKARKEQERILTEKKAEEERLQKEKAEQEEREKLKLENEKLKRIAEEKEKELVKERRIVEEKMKIEQEKKIELEKKAKKEQIEKEKLEVKLKEIKEEKKNAIVKCPKCKHEFRI